MELNYDNCSHEVKNDVHAQLVLAAVLAEEEPGHTAETYLKTAKLKIENGEATLDEEGYNEVEDCPC
jgi:hypothetical protein